MEYVYGAGSTIGSGFSAAGSSLYSAGAAISSLTSSAASAIASGASAVASVAVTVFSAIANAACVAGSFIATTAIAGYELALPFVTTTTALATGAYAASLAWIAANGLAAVTIAIPLTLGVTVLVFLTCCNKAPNGHRTT